MARRATAPSSHGRCVDRVEAPGFRADLNTRCFSGKAAANTQWPSQDTIADFSRVGIMITSAPKLRSDLTVRRQETNGERFFIVKDPVSGEFFRFREAEQFIAQQFDGERPLEVVRKNTEEKFGAMLSPETLSGFVKNLQKTGLLETDEPSTKSNGKRSR